MSMVEWVDYTGCPRCQGSGHWPPSKYAEAHHRQGDCDWCGGYGELTRAELAHHLAAQKKRRLDMMRMTPDQRRHLTKWDAG